jgi:hypothetical protein
MRPRRGIAPTWEFILSKWGRGTPKIRGNHRSNRNYDGDGEQCRRPGVRNLIFHQIFPLWRTWGWRATCPAPRMAAITRRGTRIAGACAGNAANYQTPVFNFAPTWESIYLNLDLDAHPVPAVQGSFRGVPGGTFGDLKAIISNRWVLQPAKTPVALWLPSPLAIHQAQPLDLRCSRSGATARLSRHVWRKATRLSSVAGFSMARDYASASFPLAGKKCHSRQQLPNWNCSPS